MAMSSLQKSIVVNFSLLRDSISISEHSPQIDKRHKTIFTAIQHSQIHLPKWQKKTSNPSPSHHPSVYSLVQPQPNIT